MFFKSDRQTDIRSSNRDGTVKHNHRIYCIVQIKREVTYVTNCSLSYVTVEFKIG